MGKGQLCSLNSGRRRFENMNKEDIEEFKEKQRQASRKYYEKNRTRRLNKSREIYFKAKEHNRKLREQQ